MVLQDSRCKTCPYLITSSTYESNVTNRSYNVINDSDENLSCKSQNVIYLLSCLRCNMQYVGETVIPLNKRINIHRTSKIGCDHMIDHFSDTCPNETFSIQIIEKFQGSGYDKSGKIDKVMQNKRKSREDVIMKYMLVIYPYGLNIKAKGNNLHSDKHIPIGVLFPPLPRSGIRPERNRENRNKKESTVSSLDFFEKLKFILLNNIKESFNFIRLILNNTKKKILKKIAELIMLNSDQIFEFAKYFHWYKYIMVIIDTKFYKIQQSSIFNLPDIVDL